MSKWQETQTHELAFWNSLKHNYFTEENKQIKVYAPRMKFAVDEWHRIDFEDKRVVDIGSGPSSMLIRGKNLKPSYALDPLMDRFPVWVRQRYHDAGITTLSLPAENIETFSEPVDLVIIYNVLQHVKNPKTIVDNAKKIAKEIRVFEWVNVPTDDKHLHQLSAKKLNEWFGVTGITEYVTTENSFTHAWYTQIKQ